MIHLDYAKERESIIHEFSSKLNIKFDLIDAVIGKNMVESGHPDIGAGMVGCTCSHIKMIRKALEEGKEYAVIFEDDCIVKRDINEILNIFSQVKQLQNPYHVRFDMFILGALGYTSFLPNHIGISSIYRFDGSHAILLNRKAMYSYIEKYTKLLSEGKTIAPDGLYSSLLQNGLIGLGFTDSKFIFEQKQEGMFSYVGNCTK